MATKSALKRQLRAARKQQSLMRVPAPPARPWQLTDEEVALVKNHIAKGATDEELRFCLAVARRYKLDPFRGQIWFVKRGDSSAQGGSRWVAIVGINGLQHVAARDHADYGSIDEAEFGPMHEVTWRYKGQGAIRKLQAPEWAKVSVWKKGSERPTSVTVWWDEIYPDIDYAPLVRQMPRLMLAKCARAQAIREAYPATDGLYIREEFQGPPEFTPSGRPIVYPEAETPEQEAEHNPHLKHFLENTQLTTAQAEVAAKRIEELKSSQPAAQQAAKPDVGTVPPELASGELFDKYHDSRMALAECKNADDLNALADSWQKSADDEMRRLVRVRANELHLMTVKGRFVEIKK